MEYFSGDFNQAIIKAQQATGVEVDRSWNKWPQIISNSNPQDPNSQKEMARRFDMYYKLYAEEILRRQEEQERRNQAA